MPRLKASTRLYSKAITSTSSRLIAAARPTAKPASLGSIRAQASAACW